jgi:hypothetical protein
MQRTLLELGFLPVAYVPAMVFHEVERLDVVRMARLLTPAAPIPDTLTARTREVAEVVLRGFHNREVLPRIAQAVREVPLFKGLADEQVHRLASACGVTTFEPEEVIFREGQPHPQLYVVLNGEAAITVADGPTPVGVVTTGECLGELALLAGAEHSATATARTHMEVAVLRYDDLVDLVRRRPDIGLLLYKNLATDVGKKLQRLDRLLGQRALEESVDQSSSRE